MNDKTEVIHIRVTPKEKETITDNADHRGMKPASYLRHLVEDDTVKVQREKRRMERERKRLVSL